MKDTEYEKKVIGNSKYLFVICFMPMLFNEIELQNSINLQEYLNQFINLFNGIDNFSMRSRFHDLYYFSRFQISIGLVLGFICFISSIINLNKIYECSNNKNRCESNEYFSEKINLNGFFSSNTRYILMIIFTFLMFDLYLFSYLIQIPITEPSTFIMSFLYNTKVGITLFSIGIIYFVGIILPEIIFDTVGRIKVSRIGKKKV